MGRVDQVHPGSVVAGFSFDLVPGTDPNSGEDESWATKAQKKAQEKR
jgi:hypothetical protein